ncbi:uncharacterized protein LOC119666653 [Teleopsis dalmanni]|uniref:uncharacterized protein LOC119666653 n=1 Tax=Teleopsis dalmanni TaxID=139649 RepID=UPI0018CE9FB3|nr:uncharacterized protein LOC119666653 [Teleopsis dalmanni]
MINKVTAFALITQLLLYSLVSAAPYPQNDIDSSFAGNTGAMDYNTVVGHFKDFFMYLPVMMTTLKETMTGFPKFAEGIRILTSKNGRTEDDCNCKRSSNEIENSSRYG